MLPEKLVYRSIFISDLHLGSAGSRAREISEFLRRVDCEYLYLVGDVVDAWVGGRTTRWKPGQETALLDLLQKASVDCKVRYTPGNHDAVMRRFIGLNLFNTEIEHSFVHVQPDGRRLLVIHGDEFDRFVTTYKPAAWLLANLYELVSRLNWTTDAIGQRLGWWQPSDYSKRMKKGVKSLTERASGFEEHLVAEAQRLGLNGVVCGHVHRAAINTHENGVVYYNTGDWVEHTTFIVEHFNGAMELLDWTQMMTAAADAKALPAER